MIGVRIGSLATLVSLALAIVFGGEARAQISFRKVADTATAIPGGSGSFQGFGTDFNQPSISQSNVAFKGTGSGEQEGIYADFGSGVQKIADTSTTIPGAGGTFTGFEFPVIDGTNVSYSAFGAGDFEGVYLDTGSGPMTIADTNTAVPDGTGTFSLFFGIQALSGTSVVLPGLVQGSPSQSGIYADFGSGLTTVADKTTSIPGGTGNFSILVDPTISGTNVAFHGFGESGQRGIYADLGSGLSLVADRNTAVPDGTGTFEFLSFARLSGSNLIFRGQSNGNTETGIYGDFGSGLITIADQSTMVPGGSGTFDVIGLGAISGSNVVFSAGFGGGTGIGLYAWLDGMSIPIIDSTMMLDGKQLANSQSALNFGINGFDGREIVFEALFADGSRGIYVASLPMGVIPEPATLALFGLGIVGLAVAARRRRKP